ncbi:MAG: hypothetical protein ACRDD6_06440 [Tannerellaceae bacterium]
MASRSAASACGGPMDTTVMVPPVCVFISTAACSACKSYGFTCAFAPARTSVLVSGSMYILVEAGTCLIKTIYSKTILFYRENFFRLHNEGGEVSVVLSSITLCSALRDQPPFLLERASAQLF